jgi:hypothetical protein
MTLAGRRLGGGLAAITVILVLATGALALRNGSQIFATPLTEDGFYSLAVARNVARGAGITADGRQPTNGFQPLFTAVEAGCYRVAGGDEVPAVRLVLGLSWLIYVATAWLVGAIAADLTGTAPSDGSPAAPSDGGARRHARRWLAGLLYGGGFLSFMHHFNGLETGLVLLLYAVSWRAYQHGWFEHRFGSLGFGALFGLLVLARIDAAVFVALFCAWQLAARWRTEPGQALWRAGSTAAVAVIVSSPWWAYNYFEFGSLMPTSGTAQQEWALSARRLRWVLWALGVSSLPTMWLGRFDELFHDGIVPSALRALVIGALALFIARAWRQASPLAGDATMRARRTVAFGAMLAAAMAALALYYGLSFIAYWFYYRYLFPVALIASVLIAWWAAPLALAWPRIAVVVVALLCAPTMISAVMAQRGHTLHVDTVYWEQLALVDEQVPEADLVAAGQTGTLGYFRARTVNVDGKVNREAIPYQDHMWDYLARRDVRWFADWPFYVEKYLGHDPADHGWHKVGQKGYWQLWHRE